MKKVPQKINQSSEEEATVTPEEQGPTIIVEPVVQQNIKNKKSLFSMVMLVLAAIALMIAFPTVQTIVSRSASNKCQPITKVMLNPGTIQTFTNSPPMEMSVLAYDRYNRPVWKGVKYEYGISSVNGIGTIKARHDLATFFPLKVGIGDLYVKTTNNCTRKAIIGSVKVTVKQGLVVTPTVKKKNNY